jgi:hypothetical protein
VKWQIVEKKNKKIKKPKKRRKSSGSINAGCVSLYHGENKDQYEDLEVHLFLYIKNEVIC